MKSPGHIPGGSYREGVTGRELQGRIHSIFVCTEFWEYVTLPRYVSRDKRELQTSVVWVSISYTCTVLEIISISCGGMRVDDMFPFHKMWSNVVNDFKFQMEVPMTPDMHTCQ